MPWTQHARRAALGLLLLAGPALGCSHPPQAQEPQAPAPAEPAATEPAATTPEAPPAARTGTITKASFGQVEGKDVDLYTLTNTNGIVVKVSTFGATVTEVQAPDRNGKLADIVHGFDRVEDYAKSGPYFGATIGRVANRIKGASFVLDGKTYKLALNNPDTQSSLHGGQKGWDKVLWTTETSEGASGPSIKLTHVSADGEEGYPGTVTATTTYTLTSDNQLRIEMQATTDKPTIVNMANHTYWNLGGTGSGTVLDEEVQLFADKYTPGMPPTGEVKPVKGTPFDFTAAKPIGRDLKAAGGKPVGFDHNFIVDGNPAQLRPVARVKDPKSGRVLTLEADQPGVQFYTGNFLDGSTRGKGVTHVQYSAFCLESQKFPNAINVPEWKDQVVLRPGQTYKHTMVYKLGVE
jgi:aldose 1-epimerase